MRLLWLLFSLAVLILFARESLTEAGLATFPCMVAVVAAIIQLALIVTFAADWLAKMLALLGLSSFAESIMKSSTSAWMKLFGEHGFAVSSKQAHLADLYLLSRKEKEASDLLDKITKEWKKSYLSPFSPACKSLASYARRLQKAENELQAKQIQSLIAGWKIWSLLGPSTMVLLVVSAASYLLLVFQTQYEISELMQDSGDQQIERDLIDDLARTQGSIQGPVAPARLYHGIAWQSYFPLESRNADQAVWAISRALSYARKHPSTENILADCLTWQGEILTDSGELEKAEPMLKEALALRSKFGPENCSPVSLDLTRIYILKKDFERARVYSEQAQSFAEKVYGKDSEQRADALVELAEILRHTKDKTNALATIENACRIYDSEYALKLKSGAPTKEDFRRIVAAYMTKQDILTDLGKPEQSEEISKHLSDLQEANQKNFRLDAATQDAIVGTAQELSKWLLALKFNAKDKAQAMEQLKEKLSSDVLQQVNESKWAQDADFTRKPLPGEIVVTFGDVSVESPDFAGYMAVKIRGTASVGGAEETPYGWYFKIRPTKTGSKKVSIQQVSELLSSN